MICCTTHRLCTILLLTLVTNNLQSFVQGHEEDHGLLEPAADEHETILSRRKIIQNISDQDLWSQNHGRSTSIIRSIMALISIASSSTLIWMICRSQTKLTTIFHRLLFALSLCDIIVSLSESSFNAHAPKELSYHVWNAQGGVTSCAFQGCIQMLGVAAGVLFNCSLNMYYLAVIKFKKTDEFIRSKIEPYLFIVPITVSLVVSTTLLIRKNFNSAGGGNCCVPVYEPPHCKGFGDSHVVDGFGIPCGRGRAGKVMANAIFFVVSFITPAFIGCSMWIIYRAVVKQEKRLERYGIGSLHTNTNNSAVVADEQQQETIVESPGTRFSKICFVARKSQKPQSRPKSNSRAVMHKAFAYSMAYFLVWTPLIMIACYGISNTKLPHYVKYLASIFSPLQGFYNFVIYIHPKVMKAKKSRQGEENITWFRAFRKTLWFRGGENRRGATSTPSLSS